MNSVESGWSNSGVRRFEVIPGSYQLPDRIPSISDVLHKNNVTVVIP